MAVVASATGAAVFGLSGVAAGLAGGALLGAGIGGLYSAVTGDGDILNSMLTGGLIGGAAGGLGAAYAAPTLAAEAATAAGATGAGTVGPAATTVATPTAASMAAMTPAQAAAMTPAQLNAIAAANGVVPELGASLKGAGLMAAPEVITPQLMAATGAGGTAPVTAGLTGKEMLGYGLAGTAAMSLLGGRKGGTAPASATDPGMIRPFTFSPNQTAHGSDYPSPYAKATYDAAGMPIMDTRERNYFDQKYTAQTPYSARAGTPNPNIPVAAAAGGLMAIGGPVERMTQNMMGGQGNMYPLSQQEHTNFATPTQMPASAEVIRSDYDAKTNPYTGVMMANGGIARFADKGAVNEDDVESYKERMKRLKNMNEMLKDAESSSRISVPGMEYMPDTYVPREPSRINFNANPETFVDNPQMKGVMGRAGANYALDRDTSLMAGLSGFAGKDRGAMTVKPSTMDIGVARKVGPGYLSGQYQRSLTGQEPARYMANYAINMAEGGITYDAATQRYSGLPSSAPAAPVEQLPADLVASLTPQYQAANPNFFSYDAKNQRYGAGIPSMSQLSAFKSMQDQKAAEEAAAAASRAYEGYAMGGNVISNLGGYSDGGRLLRGPGDGVSDDIPATIAGKQPARLADGEFVIPARIVSEIGNGSTDAGAKRLYAMMDKIQAGRKKTIGKKNIAKDTKAKKHLLA